MAAMMDDEKVVRDGFWAKVKRTAGKVPFLPDAVALYFCAVDPRTPLHAKVIAFSALAYFISPLDVIPDWIIGLGYGDDAVAVLAAIKALATYMTDEHRDQARRWLAGEH